MKAKEFKNPAEEFELPVFKERREYLEAINGHPEEKIGLVIECLRENNLPIINSKIFGAEDFSLNIFEIGPGGGSSLEYLKQYVAQHQREMPRVRIFSLEYLPRPIQKEIRKLKPLKDLSGLVLGKAQELPFRSESVSAVNLSAVLHEVNSYSVYGKGFGSINRTIEEISRVIAPGGILAYRDVYAPLEGIKKFETHVYSSPSWIGFIKWFVPYLLNHGRVIYKDQEEGIILKQNNKKVGWKDIDIEQELEIYAPLGLLREIQRHYITLRDYLLKSRGLGIEVIQEEWVNLEEGIKAITILIDSENQTLRRALEKKEYCEKIKTNIYRISDSLIFDRIVDKCTSHLFSSKKGAGDKVSEAWLKREGAEYYIYYNIPEMITVTAEISKKQSGGEYILMPRDSKDIVFFPRNYYQRYLENTLKNPLREGKQAIRFWKTKTEDAERFLDNLEEYPKGLKQILGNKTQEVITALRQIIKK